MLPEVILAPPPFGTKSTFTLKLAGMLPNQCGARVAPLQPRLLRVAYDKVKTIRFRLKGRHVLHDHQVVMVHLSVSVLRTLSDSTEN